MKHKAQIITCKCGWTFAICREPECYSQKDWQKDVRNYIKKGCTVDTLEISEAVEKYKNSGGCKCDEIKKEAKIKNQIELF